MSHSDCPLELTIKKIGDVPTLLIIKSMSNGASRFCHFQKEVRGISSATISDRLKKIVEWEWATRKIIDSNPPIVEYSLTPLGLKVAKIVQSLSELN